VRVQGQLVNLIMI